MRVSPGVHAKHCILRRSHALLKMPCLSSYVFLEAQHSQILGSRIPNTIARSITALACLQNPLTASKQSLHVHNMTH